MPWKPVLVFVSIAVGATTAIALVTSSMGWTVASPGWAVLVPLAMWAPALGRLVARRTVDRGFTGTLPLRLRGATGIRVVVAPLAYPLLVYGAAYLIAWTAGLARWDPGNGRWTSGSQVAVNLVVNLAILAVFGTFTALGEELGWRGYLQPRLDAAGVRASLVVLWLAQLAYHAPLMAGADYADVGGLVPSLLLFAAGDLAVTFILAAESYLAASLWPAVFLHSFHNTISQWLFPHLFSVQPGQAWLAGESGVLPAIGYAAAGLLLYLSMRRQGITWRALVESRVAAS